MIVAMVAAAALLADGAADVGKLAWMAGTWIQEKDGTTTRETWLAPLGGVMGGVGQTNRPGRKPFVEHMTISAEPAGVTFTPNFPGQPPVAFVLKPGGDGEAVFENPAHDFPQRVIYRPCGADLCARIEGVAGGAPKFQEWRYTRAN